jgi:hypothetical protein
LVSGSASGVSFSNNIGSVSEGVSSYTQSINVPSTARGTLTIPFAVQNGTAILSSTSFSINVTNVSSLILSNVASLTTSQAGIINITNNGNQDFPSVNLSSTGASVSLSANNFPLAAGASRTVTVTLSNPSSVGAGVNTVTITAEALGASTSTSFSFGKSFCRNGTVGELFISDISISSSGDDDEEWKPLDEIRVNAEVENPSSDNIRSVNLVLGLIDSNGRNVAGDLTFTNEDEDRINLGTIEDDSNEEGTFEFTVPADLDSGDYQLVVKAYSSSAGESNQCADTSTGSLTQTVSVEEETDEGKFIAFTDIRLSPTQSVCGDSVTLTFDVANIGSDDQDRVRVNLYNKALGIDSFQEIRNLDSGDEVSMSFTFTVPQVNDGNYNLELTADYDYRNNDYRESSDDATSQPLKVFGCSIVPSVSPLSISAELDSSAEAGDELVVRTTIRNTATSRQDVTLSVSDYDSWADLNSVSSRSFSLQPGESKVVTVNLQVDKSVTGEKTFTVEASSNGTAQTREVTVDFGEKSSGLSGLFGNSSLIWVIGAINIILIIVIIIVAIRIARS